MKIIASLNELSKVSNYLDTILPSSSIVFLKGDLASGKTTLTQAIAKEKGVKDKVTSPTFSLQQCYLTKENTNLFHYDLYRLEYEEFMEMGLFEEFEKSGWHFVEWGSDRLKVFLESVGYSVITVEIESYDDKRLYRID